MALASVIVDIVRQKLGSSIPLASLAGSTWLLGVVFMVAIGLIVGALPALRGMRLRVIAKAVLARTSVARPAEIAIMEQGKTRQLTHLHDSLSQYPAIV